MQEGETRRSARGRGWWLLLLLIPAAFATVWIWIAVVGAGSTQAQAGSTQAQAVLRDLLDRQVGRVTLSEGPGDSTTVRYLVAGLPAGFHAFHVHVNGVCDATLGFDSIGVHYDHERRQQPFDGDMPVILVGADGRGSGSFVTERFSVDDVEGMALVVHAFSDNYANVPIGTSNQQYRPNGPSAVDLTSGTGNAGSPIACGVVQPAP